MKRLKMEPIDAEAAKRTRDPAADVPPGLRHRRHPRERTRCLRGRGFRQVQFVAARYKALLASTLATMI